MAWSVPQETRIPKSLLCKYSDTFRLFDGDVGCTSNLSWNPSCGWHPSMSTVPPPAPSQFSLIKVHIQELLQQGVVRVSCSHYASPIVAIRKKVGDIWLCIDYRQLNPKTPTRFPISGTNGWENGILYPVWPLHSLTRCHSGYATRPGHYRVWWSKSLATRVSNLSCCI